jgi:NAD dependent epimerase/dehydratase
MMKKLLVTGAAGFIGSHLVEECVRCGYNVKAFARYNSKNSWGWLESSPVINEIEVVTGDIRDYDSVANAMADCSAVFHLAALIGIPYSYESPLAYIKTNIEGTYNILQAAKKYNLDEIVITSTSETYGTARYVPIDEEHPLTGQSPYSASKIAADQLAVSYYRSFQLPVKIARPFNTYGPRQSARAIIPAVIIQLLNDDNNIKLGNLNPTRDFTYVEDTVKGFIEILQSRELYGEITNIGMNDEISINKLVSIIGNLMSKTVTVIPDARRKRVEKSEVDRLVCNNSKIREKTNWKPQYTLIGGLTETIEWVKANKECYKSSVYNI